MATACMHACEFKLAYSIAIAIANYSSYISWVGTEKHACMKIHDSMWLAKQLEVRVEWQT